MKPIPKYLKISKHILTHPITYNFESLSKNVFIGYIMWTFNCSYCVAKKAYEDALFKAYTPTEVENENL